MPFQSVPDTVLAEVRYSNALVRIENTLYIRNLAGYTQEYLDDLAEAIFNTWAADVLPVLSADLQLVEVYCKGLENAIDLQSLYVPGAPVAGGVASPTLPNSVACCISFRTGFTGRSARGRVYIPGIPEGNVTGDQFTGSFANGLASDIATFFGDLLPSFPGAQHVIVSRYTAGALRPTGETLPVTAYVSTDNFVDSRRSRVK